MHGPKSCRLVSGEVEGNIVITGVTQKNCQNQKRHDPNAFSRVVVPMALKQVSTKPGPCPASSGPRACLAPAPGMTRRRRQGLATGTGFRVTSLRQQQQPQVPFSKVALTVCPNMPRRLARRASLHMPLPNKSGCQLTAFGRSGQHSPSRLSHPLVSKHARLTASR